MEIFTGSPIEIYCNKANLKRRCSGEDSKLLCYAGISPNMQGLNRKGLAKAYHVPRRICGVPLRFQLAGSFGHKV
jgi:hypothetical protein